MIDETGLVSHFATPRAKVEITMTNFCPFQTRNGQQMSSTGVLRSTVSRIRRAGSHQHPAPTAGRSKRGLFPAERSIPRPDSSLGGYGLGNDRFEQVALVSIGRMNMAGLRPEHDVLDIGCGIGRIARYLCAYLDSTSRYEGFDVVEEPVHWCRQNITPLFPNFTFQFTPLFNARYNTDASSTSAATFRFPYPDESFDFVFAHSIFTHLVPDEANNYLREIVRVLRRGGTTYCTWILFKEGSPDYNHAIVSRMHRDRSGSYALLEPDMPGRAGGYDEQFVLDAYRASGLQLTGPIHPGFLIQDAIVATK